MTRFHQIAAALSLILAAPAFAADADAPTSPVSVHEQMMMQIRDLQNRSHAGQWINPWMPIATGMMVDSRESADTRLQTIVAGYDRAALDRGGWRNPWVAGHHYAAGEPLLAAAVGAGVTSGGAAAVDLPRQLAAR